MRTHQNDSYFQTQRVKQRTIYANYRITQQAFLEGRTIHLPSPSNIDGSVLASLAGGPLQFTPTELTRILQINSTVPVVNSSVPGQPTLSGSPGSVQVILTWTVPSNGGSPITSYTINWIPGSGSLTVTSGTTATITGLTPSTTYTFTVLARNALGSGPASAPFSVTTSAVGYGWALSTYAGGGALLDPFQGYSDGSGIFAKFNYPSGIATDSSGNIYIADTLNYRIRKIDSTGLVTTIAGDGLSGTANGQGTNARFNQPSSVTIDTSGNIYVADTSNHQIRKIDSSMNVTTIAGDGSPGYGTGVGTNAQFYYPSGITIDSSGNIYVGDTVNNLIRKIDSSMNVTTIAGDGLSGTANGQGTNAQFNYPNGVITDSSGNIYVADTYNNRFRKIDLNGFVTTIAGDGSPGTANGQGTNAQFEKPKGLTRDSNGNIYIADSSNNSIRKIDLNGFVTTIAGSTYGFADGSGTEAKFRYPNSVALDASGNIYVADYENNLIRKIDSSMNVTSIGGACNVPRQSGYGTGLGTNVRFNNPFGVARDSSGNIYVADRDNNCIRKIDSTGLVTTIAGDEYGYGTGIGTNARFNYPYGVTIDTSGNIYVADSDNNLIRMIDSNGVVTTIAGDGTYGYGTGVGTNARFNNPRGVALDGNGNIYVADTYNHRIRKIDSSMNVTTIAGDGDDGYGTGVGTNARFDNPTGIATDGNGNIYVADRNNHLIRMIDSNMNVTTIAGDGSQGYGTGVGTNARFSEPRGVATDSSGNIYVADSENNLIRMIDSSMNVTTLVGGGPNTTNWGSINGVGTNAMLNYPTGIATDGNGNIYIADSNNNTIKKLVFINSGATVPGQPTDLSGTAEITTVTLTWTAPSNGGSPIISYTVGWNTSQQVVSGTTATITGLTPSTTYTFTVLATNAVGNGLASAPYLITTMGQFIVVGGNGENTSLVYSTDGITYYDASGDSIPFNGGQCNAIAYNGTNTWVAGAYIYSGNNAKLLYSTDGQYWHDASGDSIPFGNGQCNAIAYNGTNKWVAGGYSDGAKLLYSTDGQYWHDASGDSILFQGGGCRTIAYDGTNKWVAGGAGNARLLYSSDGQYWYDASGDSILFYNGMCNAIAYGGTTWVAGGNNRAILLYSTDGQYWHDASGDSIPFENGSCSAIAYNGSTWVAGGYNDNRITNLLYSTDGMTWHDASGDSILFQGGGCRTIAYDGTNKWVAGGYNGSVNLLYSTDGQYWHDASGDSLLLNNGFCTSIAYTGSKWIAGGHNSDTNHSVDILYSTNGEEWYDVSGSPRFAGSDKQAGPIATSNPGFMMSPYIYWC